jgi:hypothetical protein
VRPLSMAKRVPRDYVFTGWPVGAGSPTGTCSGEANSPIAGVRSPPLRWGEAEQGWPSGENPGITRRVVFPEGRTLCARLARPHGCQGISLRPHPLMRAPGPSGDMPRVKPVAPLWACGARPSPGLTIRGKLAFRPRAGNHAKSDSFGRAPSVRPDCEAGLSP